MNPLKERFHPPTGGGFRTGTSHRYRERRSSDVEPVVAVNVLGCLGMSWDAGATDVLYRDRCFEM